LGLLAKLNLFAKHFEAWRKKQNRLALQNFVSFKFLLSCQRVESFLSFVMDRHPTKTKGQPKQAGLSNKLKHGFITPTYF